MLDITTKTNDILLADHVIAIRQLAASAIEGMIEIGRHLIECKKIVGRWLSAQHGNNQSQCVPVAAWQGAANDARWR